MQRQIVRVGIALMVAFIAVFVQLNYVQIFAAEDIASNNANIRGLLREYSIERGDILTNDGVRIATSRRTGGRFKYRRTYPEGDLYGHITGFYSILYGKTAIEARYDDQLLGDSGVLSMQDIEDRLFDSGEQGDDVRLTIESELQETARAAIGDERGAAVALDPTTGQVKAMWGNPSYDPTPLAAHESATQREYWNSLDPKNTLETPLLNIATSRGYPPGSTFKVVTATAALESGEYDLRSPAFPDPAALDLPQTDDTLTNFTNTACQGGQQIDLFTALTISCDTTFAILGLEIFPEIFELAEKLGFNDPIPFDIGTVASQFPDIGDDNLPSRAKAAIGQQDVVATPLQMALVAATIANSGEVPLPRLVEEIIDPSGGIVRSYGPETIGRAMSTQTAADVTAMMVSAVQSPSGTGGAARMPGVEVAGKTGTAQTVEGANPHTWFIAFAPADAPQIAVAVIVEHGGAFGSEATGGAVAAPIARQIMEKAREIDGW
ncbi:MAG: peptidoglycan D,D-transpeptidase FtsI family protein [Actinomycetota bacterium]